MLGRIDVPGSEQDRKHRHEDSYNESNVAQRRTGQGRFRASPDGSL